LKKKIIKAFNTMIDGKVKNAAKKIKDVKVLKT